MEYPLALILLEALLQSDVNCALWENINTIL